MTDRAILAVINPPASERTNRAALTAAPTMPGKSAARAGPNIGAPVGISGALTVTSNHFPVNPDACPATITQYHVHLYRVGRDHANRSEDIAAEEDARKTVQVMKTLRTRHPEWMSPPTGFAYDTKSTLFTSRALGFTAVNTDGQQFHSEIVGLPNKDGNKTKHYRAFVTDPF